MWNSTFKAPAKPMQRSKPMKTKQNRKTGAGLAQRVAKLAGTSLQHERKPSRLLRSKAHRQNVAALDCAICGRHGPSQAAHINFSKGFALKADDSLTFPACPACHANHDQGGMPRQERWKREWEYVDATRAKLIRKGLWTAEIEAHYQRAIEPLSRVVHGEGK